MSEWTPEARQHLDEYLQRIADLCRQQGDDADEVTANLKDHVAVEVEKEAASLVTLDLLRRILTRVGSPEEVTDAQAASVAAPAPETLSSHVSTPADKGARIVRSARVTTFVIFCILVPLTAILIELAGGFLASVYVDPMPTLAHVAVLLLLPFSFAFCAIYLESKKAITNPGWSAAAFTLNAFATAVSLIYLIVYIPVMPLAVIAILFVGLGVLGLSPVFCTAGGLFQMRRLYRERRLAGLKNNRMFVGNIAGIVIAILLLGGLEVPRYLIDRAIIMACSDDPGAREQGIQLIQTFGGEDEVLESCYGRPPKRGRRFVLFDFETSPVDVSQYRQLYFRVTGRPFNSVPRPNVRSDGRNRIGGGVEWEEEWLSGSEIGGDIVAGVVCGLSLFSSTMDVDIETHGGSAGPAVAYMEWTMEFKNSTRRQREARAQIVLPADAVSSRLTLWIDGEEREAAFGGRSQVRGAYKQVAVVQRRDPALLTTAGSDRVLLQCFPIEPGKTMKTKIGITVPLSIRSGKAALRLPYFAERNFSVARDFAHQVWAEAGAKIDWAAGKIAIDGAKKGTYTARGKLTDAELLAARAGAIWLPAAADTGVYEAKLGTATALMSWAAPVANPEPAVCLVVDGSSAMNRADIDWRAVCNALPPKAKVTAVFAGHRPAKWREGFVPVSEAKAELAMWLEGQDCKGGCDPVPALEEAWDMASGERGAVVVWVHGPLPVRLSSAEGLLQRLRRAREGKSVAVRILSVSVAPGPNRLAEDLREPAGFKRVPVLGSLNSTLTYVAANLRSTDARRSYKLALGGQAVAGGTAGSITVSDQLVRLAVFEEARTLLRKGSKDDMARAMALAVSTRLVSQVSGAVVLETKEQYDRHDLNPSAEAKPSVGGGNAVPEPGGAALAAIGLLLAARRRKRRA